MSRVEKVEAEVKSMSAHELAAFCSWFSEYKARHWDCKIEADAISRRLRPLAVLAFREDEDGQSPEL